MPNPTFTVGMEFVTGSFTNVTSFVDKMSINRGLGTVLRGIEGGSALLQLNNTGRQFSPANSASPYYPYVRPQTKVQIQAMHSNSTYPLFLGWTRRISVDPKLGSRAAVIEAEDAMERMGAVTLVSTLMTDLLPSSLFAVVMSQSNVNSFAADVISSYDMVTYAWYRDRNAANALRELIEYGQYSVYQDGAGTVLLRNRYYGIGGTAILSLSEAFDMSWNSTAKDAVNLVRVASQPRAVSASVNTIAWLKEVPSIPASSYLSFWLTYVDPVETTVPTPATSMTTPVSSVDFFANTASDGGGSDRTSTLSANVALFAETAICSLFNASADTVYVTKFQIRGFAVREQPKLSAQYVDSSSQNVYGKQELSFESPFMSRQGYVTDYAKSLVDQRKDPLAKISLSIKNQWPEALAMEPGTLLAVNEVETQTNSLLSVLRVNHDIVLVNGLEHLTTVETEVAPALPYLVLDDPVRGSIDGTNVLAF